MRAWRNGWVNGLTVAAILVGPAAAQDYPNKPIRIVTAGIGGGIDFASRLMAQGLSANLGQQVVVDNRVGVLSVEIVPKAPPDGYTLAINGSVIWLLPFLRDHVPWDPLKDLAAITMLASSPNVVVAHPGVAANSIKELVALARAKPGFLNYATSGTGTTNHISGELFKSMAGVDIVRVNYKNVAPALTDLLAGQVQLMFLNVPAVVPHAKSGKLKALAVTSARASALLPELPTVAASGVAGYESVSVIGMFAPAATPAALVNRLNLESKRALDRPDVKEKFFNAGVETVGSSPQEFTARIRSEMGRLGKVIKDAGIRAD